MKTLVVHALVLAVGLAVAPLASAQGSHQGHGAAQSQDLSDASKAYMAAMERMDEDMKTMPMTGKPGVDFAVMMIPHHQSAIDMAKAYLESGENDPELTKLSNEIVAAQESEIAFLKKWLANKGH